MFGEKIISWYLKNKRDLPWRNTKNPYKIWLSEIILQQTRVAQGLPYYHKFVENFPTINELADADEGEILRTWQGLGYYSRGRNLHKTAKIIKNEYSGKFPEHFEDLKKLKGIGPYTAAAIASFAFDQKVAAIDGNALRVISRFFEIKKAIDSPKTHKEIFEISNSLLESVNSGLYNQAIMELGATVCLPKSPNCSICPINTECKSKTNGSVTNIPYKEKKVKVKNRTFLYVVFEYKGKYWLKKRGEKDIWENMYDFYLIENKFDTENLSKDLEEKYTFKITSAEFSETFKHILTHQRLMVSFLTIKCKSKPKLEGGKFFELTEIEELPKPKIIVDYFKNLLA